MNFREYQEKAFTTALPSIKDNIYYHTLGLSGEAGEICNKIKKVMRDKNGEISDEMKESLKAEIGDVMWYVASLCTVLGLDLEDVCSANLDKLYSRMERNKLSGSGDNR